ncbi:MAG TPA: hypothetical protein ENI20_08425 [Bacteroides sp.]|nr:hypothetical protein [Bacteroides sp.]
MITYLLGAGASYNCIPVVGNFKQRVDGLLKYITKTYVNRTAKNDIKDYESFAAFLKDFNRFFSWLMNEESADLLAMKLYKSEKFEFFYETKIWLTLVILLFQYYRPHDARYDKFFANIYQDFDGPISNISRQMAVISWNYDIQFEISYSDFLDKGAVMNTRMIQAELDVYPSFSNNDSFSKFSITKLNGSAIVQDHSLSNEMIFDIQQLNRERIIKDDNQHGLLHPEVINNIVDLYNFCKKEKPKIDLTFSWESDNPSNAEDRAKRVMEKTEELIIIGYSFPELNRKVDESLFLGNKSIKRIQIQNPNFNEEKVIWFKRWIEECTESTDIKTEIRTNVEEFLSPMGPDPKRTTKGMRRVN